MFDLHVNAKNDEGVTALSYCAITGQLDVCRALLEYQADVNAKQNDERTPLHRACQSGSHTTLTSWLNSYDR